MCKKQTYFRFLCRSEIHLIMDKVALLKSNIRPVAIITLAATLETNIIMTVMTRIVGME